MQVDLEPYRTQTVDYRFYFPGPGKFPLDLGQNPEVLPFPDFAQGLATALKQGHNIL